MSQLIENAYREVNDALSAHQRVARSAAMLGWAREAIGRQIVLEQGPMTPERLKWEIALRQYGGDPLARSLIQRMIDHVSS